MQSQRSRAREASRSAIVASDRAFQAAKFFSKLVKEACALASAVKSAVNSCSELVARSASAVEFSCKLASSALELSSKLANSSELLLESSSSLLSSSLRIASLFDISSSLEGVCLELAVGSSLCSPEEGEVSCAQAGGENAQDETAKKRTDAVKRPPFFTHTPSIPRQDRLHPDPRKGGVAAESRVTAILGPGDVRPARKEGLLSLCEGHVEGPVLDGKVLDQGNPFIQKPLEVGGLCIVNGRGAAEDKASHPAGEGAVEELAVVGDKVFGADVGLAIPGLAVAPHIVDPDHYRKDGGPQVLAVGLPAREELDGSVARNTAVQNSNMIARTGNR